MARAMGVLRVADQAGAVQPYQSVTILDDDGSAFAQTLYAAASGAATLSNPLVADDLGLIVAYVDTPQRAIARVTLDGVAYDVPFDFVDDPADLLTTPFAVAGLVPGAAHQGLLTNAAGTAAVWGASPQSLMTAAGDILVASGANTPARLPLGAARQALLVNAAATGLAYGASLQSLLTATGDLPYASGANTPARLPVGTDGQVLMLASGLPSWQAPSFTVTAAAANLLANGSMRVSQRSPTPATAFPVAADMTYQANDRWKTLQDAGAAWFVSYHNLAPTTALRSMVFVSGGNSAKGGALQILENADTVPLRTLTVSLQARFLATAGVTDLRWAILSWTGAADAPTDPVSAWNAAGTNPTLAANWAYVNTPANLSIPASTWTLATLNNQAVPGGCVNLAVMVWCEDTAQTASTDFWGFTGAQLEQGAAATNFQRISYAAELLRCQRYYYKTFPQGTAPATNSGVTQGCVAYVTQVAGTAGPNGAFRAFPSTMRAAPAITTYNPLAANANWRNVTLGADSGVPSGVSSDAGMFMYNPQVGGDLPGHTQYLHFTADAEL